VRSYWLAARRLSEVAATERSDALFVPVAFLWRHTIELALKRGTRWLASEVEEDGLSAAEKKLMGRHDLLALWTSWELRQKRVHPDWSPKDVARARPELEWLVQLETDPSGFRYRTGLNGAAVSRPERVDVNKFAAALDVVVGVVMFLEDELEEQLEARREFGP
jgi:hypothetical protein